MRNKGVVIIFVLMTLIPILGFIGLLVDVGRFFIVSRQLQNAADSAALAGANMLFACDPNNTFSVPHNVNSCVTSHGGWVAVKPIIQRVLEGERVLEGSFGGLAWTGGATTRWDSANWSHIAAANQSLEVAVNRWHACHSTGTRFGESRVIPIDPVHPSVAIDWLNRDLISGESCNPEEVNCAVPDCRQSNPLNTTCLPYSGESESSYCVANAVTASARHVRGLEFFFARLFMPTFNERMRLTRTSTAIMRYPYCRGLPRCHETRRLASNYTDLNPLDAIDSTKIVSCPPLRSGNPNNSWPGPALPWPTPTPLAPNPVP